jgi:nitrite reductase (NADH) small subunit
MIARNWKRITAAENVPLREGRAVRLGRMEVALFNLGGRFVAIENKCPHQGGPLCDGIVAGTTVVCPLHGWKFDLDSGAPVLASLPVCLTTFPTRVEDGVILVDVAGGSRIEDDEVAA